MAIPDYQSFMLPMLHLLASGQEHAMSEVYEALADKFELTQEERSELLSSGQQAIYQNRIGWAKTYLVKAELLESPKRGRIRMTPLGRKTLESGVTHMDNKYLAQFEGFRDFRRRSNNIGTAADQISETADNEATPAGLLGKPTTGDVLTFKVDRLIGADQRRIDGRLARMAAALCIWNVCNLAALPGES